MERLSAVASAASSLPEKTNLGFVSWYEVFVSSDKGRKEVRFYLKRGDGSSDLAVVGKEKSGKHMSYRYSLQNRFINSVGMNSKLKSRTEVVDWLSSVVSDSECKSQQTDRMDKEGAGAYPLNAGSLKLKLAQHTRDFSWIGCPWTCKRKLRHYPSFSRHGVNIAVNEFVYVLAEEGKRLVAYLEDLYEDPRGNRMVVVRWFHRIDEVDIDLPHNFNDREIFFSLCLQDLSVECIDGLATVLGSHHFQKFQNEAQHTRLEPYVCTKQFDSDEIKPFDITQVKGYWKQEILRYMYALSPSKAQVRSQHSEDDASAEMRPRKRHRQSKNDDSQINEKKRTVNVSSSLDFKASDAIFSPKWGCASKTFIGKELKNNSSSSQLGVGSKVEVLSQDSGIRGCWFRASIIKKRSDKMKVLYCDLRDADDESNNLMEWLLASRVAAVDHLGLRINGRLLIRPQPGKDSNVSLVYNVGTVVDVWRHDGWWEGIIVQKESEDKFRVHLPGTNQVEDFSREDLRQSQEWFGNRWMHMPERPDIATTILSQLANESFPNKAPPFGVKSTSSSEVTICESKSPPEVGSQSNRAKLPREDGRQSNEAQPNINTIKAKESCRVRDLLKDSSLGKLQWTVSRKRSHHRSNFMSSLKHIENRSKPFPSPLGRCDRIVIRASMKVVDPDNCKCMGDLFNKSVVSPFTNLLMSR